MHVFVDLLEPYDMRKKIKLLFILPDLNGINIISNLRNHNLGRL